MVTKSLTLVISTRTGTSSFGIGATSTGSGISTLGNTFPAEIDCSMGGSGGSSSISDSS